MSAADDIVAEIAEWIDGAGHHPGCSGGSGYPCKCRKQEAREALALLAAIAEEAGEASRLRAGLASVRDVAAAGHAGLVVKVCDRILRTHPTAADRPSTPSTA